MARALETPDPLSVALEPPPNETPAERWAREQEEALARRISDQIDDQIKAEKTALKRRKPPIKVLLLGQSESGKSTTVKSAYIPVTFCCSHLNPTACRLSARVCIFVLFGRACSMARRHSSQPRPLDHVYDECPHERIFYRIPWHRLQLIESHRLLLLYLAPLRRVQRDLEKSLGAASMEDVHSNGADAAPWANGGPRFRPREFAVTSRSGWKSALNRVRGIKGDGDSVHEKEGWQRQHPRRPSVARIPIPSEPEPESESDLEHAAEIIASCARDALTLWNDPVVRAVLGRKGLRPEEGPGFFLNDIERVTAHDYQPSDSDVVRARLRTMGVQEHRFVFEKGSETGQQWLIYDVGGARSLRHAWYPYFDDINAIIFLAPISCFDEQLAEDKNVNRLQDSLLLWKAVCSTKLLAKVQLILFLNKCDLLQKKLARGVRIYDYIPSFGDRPNDAPSAAKYFRNQFKDTLNRYSPQQRGFYSYLTSVVDTKATAIQVAAVREGIQRNHLKDADIL